MWKIHNIMKNNEDNLTDLVDVQNEDVKEDSRTRIEVLGRQDLKFIICIYLCSIIFFAFFTFYGFFHFSQGSRRYPLDSSPLTKICLPSYELNNKFNFYSFKLYAVQKVPQIVKEKFHAVVKVERQFNEDEVYLIRSDTIDSILEFNDFSKHSLPFNIVSSHDTVNSTISIDIAASVSHSNIDHFYIQMIVGSASISQFLIYIKLILFITFLVIVLLLIWVILTMEKQIYVLNFIATVLLWAFFHFQLLFYGKDSQLLLFFIPSAFTKVVFSILTKAVPIILIIGIETQPNTYFKKYSGLFFIVMLDLIASISTQLSVFKSDQISNELLCMKFSCLCDLIFAVYLIYLFMKCKKIYSILSNQQLVIFFTVSFIFIVVKFIINFILAINEKIQFLLAGKIIELINSFIFTMMMLFFGWPIGDDIWFHMEISYLSNKADETNSIIDYERDVNAKEEISLN
ncbi:hypothetical protein TRFO_37656 [Tritrichomonas foetus]|uniref:Uncharacterized protein n=1 Tax=Tritrichomonas foetus TaxID=1144522 RepID=A0A1J4JF01_9EUKA|nr:hypothetical protein TRFO_37656 [Tritrichomonas foetus]|eukprot:OHS96219.1 hypothetical protein TRFO_37656 [Tritrichomonas foetus]